MKKIILICIIALFFSVQYAHAEKIKVVASIFPLGDIARQVGGERVDVKVMLPPGASPHTFEPTPLEMIEIQKANVFVKVGAGLEFWAEKMLGAAGGKKLIIVEASEGIPLIKGLHFYGTETSEKSHDISESADPHVWLDPVYAKTIVDKIKDAFSKADPGGGAYYAENAMRYKAELERLHKEISEKVRGFRLKEYVSFHSAWNYFSARYGLKAAGVIEESPGREPSPKHMAKIIKEIRRTNSKAVFAEPQFNPKIAEVIAKEAGAKVLFLDPIGNPGIKGRDTYLGLMRYNLSVMEEALK